MDDDQINTLMVVEERYAYRLIKKSFNQHSVGLDDIHRAEPQQEGVTVFHKGGEFTIDAVKPQTCMNVLNFLKGWN